MKTIIVTNINEKIRLDRYIKRLYPLITQGFLESLIRKGKIKVNGVKCKSSQRLSEEDKINLYLDLNDYEDKKDFDSASFNNNTVSLASKLLNSYCLYQDDDIIIINKPSGISTQGGNKLNISIDHALQYMNSLHEKNQFRITHRLDKDTTGILLIAKNYKYASIIAEMFRNKTIDKEYLAVLDGIPINKSGVIKSNLQKIKTRDGFFVKNIEYDLDKNILDLDCVDYGNENNGNENDKKENIAITEYEIINYDKAKNISLCLFKPITGKMHQLRVHATLIGCSVVGDSKYSLINDENNYNNEKKHSLMLHATKISFDYKGQKITIESEIPKYFLLK
jgi:23S rRNA pseudouridine955/2504/2580 synthase